MKLVYSLRIFLGTDLRVGFYKFNYSDYDSYKKGYGAALKYIGVNICKEVYNNAT